MAKKIEMISVSLTEAKKAIMFCCKAGKNVYIEGPAGVGKTELVGQISKELSAPMCTSRLAQCEPCDLVGYPIPEKVGDDYQMTFSRPTIIPPKDDSEQLHIWFFDELNRANKQSINAVMQATDSCKRVGSHQLPKNLVVIGAGNPANDDAYDTAMLDAAMNNRYVHIKVHYDAKSLVAYAKQSDWHSNVVTFIQVTGDKLFNSVGYDGLPFCSPRAMESLSQLEKAGMMNDKAMHALLSQGAIGPELGMQYHAHCFELQPVKWVELGTKAGDARLGRMLDQDNYRADLISFSNDDIIEHFKSSGVMTDKDFKKLSDYLCKIHADQAAALVTQMQSVSGVSDEFKAHVGSSAGNALTNHLRTSLKK